ncbi:vacuolar protein sorting-associated protein [Thraustotheca clavata]|uniref:Vacuolar protein sorting-associated protein n=1 Tax=Thraustotheca clavata TaxID=74557 RepID=A0A1W0A3L5_9STRA|nr:vacuolar protein sorting-associated protein [Thraustotheca clavata]
MFERQVTGLLTQLLGNYVEPSCFRHDKVNVGVWSGYVVLQHLELQRKTYAELGVAVVRGVLGSVTIKIPWNRLVYDSVLVTIDDVYVLLRHTERMDLVPPTEEMEQRIKQQLIEELYRAKLETEATSSADSFATRLRNKILDNLEFHIRRIHIRLEDNHSGEHPFAIGMTMESLHVQSTDALWQPTYVDASTSKEPFIYKSVELNHLSIYLNPHCSLVSNNNDDALDPIACSIEEFTQAFGNSIPKRVDDNEPSQHHFLLKPVDASAHFKVKRDLADSSAPSMDIHVAIEQVSLQLEESQYCDLLYLFSALKTPHQAYKYQKYLPYRPTESVKKSPKGWWKYALRCVQGDNKEKRERWSWLYMQSRRADRIEYMENWEALQQLVPAQEELKMTNNRNEIEQALDAIERRRTVEDILLFRFMADQQLKKNSVVPRPQSTSDYGLWSIYRKYGWASYDDQAKRGEENTTSNVETQELYRILGYDPEEDKEMSNGCTVFSLQLTHGSVTFLNDPSTKQLRKHQNYGSVYHPQSFFVILFSHLNMDVMAAPTSTSVDVSLQTLEMFDEASEQLTFSHILKRRLPTSSLNVEITVKTPVFRMSYQTNAANLQNLKLVLEPLEIVYSPTALCWAYWSTFLQAPEALGQWAEIEVQALNELVNLKSRTDAKVEYAMAHRLPMMIDVRVQAPVLIIPASDHDFQCSRLVMDLGHVHFRTERLSSLNVNDENIQTKRSSVSTPMGLAASTTFSKQLTDEAESGEGATRWKEEFYDKFTLTMSNLHLMVLPPPVTYSPELLVQSQNTPYSIIDPFHINVTVRKSVLPLDATLYRLYIHADLPALAIHLSIPSYGHLTKVLNRFQSGQQELEKDHAASAPMLLHPMPKPIAIENREVDNISLQSDDTWFSVEYDNDGEDKKEPNDVNEIESPKHQEPIIQVLVPQVIPQVTPPEIPSENFAVSTENALVRRHPVLSLLDRRICVCTFTIPLIHINFVKGDEEDTDEYDYDGSGHGRLTFVLEGIKIRFANRTLSTALKLRLSSIVLEDHSENLPTHFIAFSCAVAPNIPYTASMPRAKSKQYARRRSSAQLALLDQQPLLDLVDVSMTIEENAPMSVDVVFGHFHVHFDQSRLASLVLQVLPLFQGSSADHDNHEATTDASFPPSFNLDQIDLPDNVKQDLQQAAHDNFVHKTVAPKPQEISPMQLKIQLHSISVCFSDPVEHLLSMAVLDVKLEMTRTKDGAANIDGRIGNVKILDLISPDLKHIKKKDKRYVYQEVLGKAPTESPSSSGLVSCHLSTSSTDTNALEIHVNKLRTVIPTRFVLKFLHYVCDGPLMEIFSSSSTPAPPPPNTSRHRRRDVFFSPALTYHDMAKQQHIASRNAERMPWTVRITMAKPYIVLPMVEASVDEEITPPMVHLQHGLILELGDIEFCTTKEKTITTMAYTTKEMHVRGLQDDFAIIQPFNFTLEMACTSVFNISARLSILQVQISEMHAALCLEWYFQCLFPIMRYLTPSSPPPAAPMPTLAVDVACDGLSLSLYTCRGQDDPMELDIYPRVAVDSTLVVNGQFSRVDIQISTAPSRSQVIVFVQDVKLLNTVIHPYLRVEYSSVPSRKDVSIVSKAWYIDINPNLVVDSVVVCMGIMFNLQATLARHYQAQQQSVPMESSMLAADLLSSDGMTSEYQWTERGGRSRADSFASSMLFDAMTTTTSLPDPIPIITHQEATWNVQVSIDTIELQLGQLIILCQMQASRNYEMLQCRLSRFKWLLADSTLVEPMDITFSHNIGDSTLVDVAKYHDNFPDEIVTSSLHLTPIHFRLHVKDLNGFHQAIDLASTLSNNLNSIANKHKQPAELKEPELGSNLYGDDVLVDSSSSERWSQIRVEFSSMEFELTEMAPLLSSHFEPAPFIFIQSPIVTLCQWECAMEMWYYNSRLLAREPLLEPFELSCEMMKIKEAPINLNINGNELKVNCTAALLDVIHFWNQLSQPSAFDMSSGYLRNNTGLPIRIFGTQIVPSGLAVPLSEAAAGATPVPSAIHSTVPVGLDGYVTIAIPLGECGVRSYRFHPMSSNLPPLECTVEISLKQGCKWVILQSGWILENKTNSPLNIQLLFPSNGLLLSSPHTCLLHPMEAYAVPLPLVGGRTTQMFVQPPNTIQWTLVEEGAVQCSSNFYVYVVNTPTAFGRSLSFCPPLIIHNALAVDMEFKLTSSASSIMALTHESGKIPLGNKLIWHGSSRQDVALQIRMQGFAWSAPAFLGGSTVVSMADLNNYSLLYVHLDVETDHVQHLEVTVFTPYWILNQTGLDLEFTHEEASLGAEHPAAFLAGQPKVRKASDDETKSHSTSVVLVSQPPVPEAKVLPQRKPHHQILPSIPPSKGLLDLIPKTQLAPKRVQTLLQACHTNQSQQTLKLQCRVRKKDRLTWSSIMNTGLSSSTDSVCTIPDGTIDKTFVIGYGLSHGQGFYERTQILTLMPRFLLVNSLEVWALDILVDETSGASVCLEKQSEMPWHCPPTAQTLRIRFSSSGWVWSGAFSLNATGDQTLRLRNIQTRTSYLLRVSIKLEGPQYRIVFRSSTNAPPYRIENFSLETIRIHQSRVRISEILLPHQTLEYTWDEPLKPRLLIVDLLPSQADDNSRPIRIGLFSMEELQSSFPTKVLSVQVLADGPTRVLRLTDLLTQSPVVASKPSVVKEEGLLQYVPLPKATVKVRLQSIGISVVDATPVELLYMYLENVQLGALSSTKNEQLAMQLTVETMQLDNQMRTTRYPVLLQCTDVSPSMQITIVRETTYTSIEFLRYVGIHVSPMRWRIDGSLLNALATMFFTNHDTTTDSNENALIATDTMETRLDDFTESTKGILFEDKVSLGEKKLYFEKFEISPIHVTLSFASSPTTLSSSQVHTIASVRQIIQAASKTLTKVHNAPLVWRALRWQHMFVPRETMLHQMSLHYQHEALRQAYVLLGSVDVLGNPVKVWHNLKGGLSSFVWEPLRGWHDFGAQGIGWGLLRGTTLLFRALVYAMLDFSTRIASSCTLGLTEACQHIDTYSGYPLAKNLYQGLAQSVSGVVVSPMHSYQKQGWRGFLPGLLAGLMGLVLKPCRGFAQAFVDTTTTLRDGLQYDIQAHVSRTRPPRYIHPRTHLLTAFSYLHASGEDIKYNIEHARQDDYVGHVMLIESRKCILVTKHRIMCLQVHWNASLLNPYSVVWEVLSDDLILVSYGGPILLYYKPESSEDWSSMGLVDLSIRVQKIDVPSKQAAFVYSMLQQVTPTIFNQVDYEGSPRQYPLFVNQIK